jgi:hypothetical protein
MQLCWKVGKGELIKDMVGLINSEEYGNGAQPLNVDLPYADEMCDIQSEISKANGKEISGLTIGEKSFNFCFPGGLELDTMIVPTSDQKFALRIFWEQW